MRAVVVILVVALSACVHTTSVRPDQLALGSGVVRTPDGRTAEIGNAYDARLVLRTGDTVTFSGPVVARHDYANELRVAGHNRSEVGFHLSDIDHVDIVEPDFWGNVALGATLGAMAAIVVVLVCMVASQPEPSRYGFTSP